MVSLTNIGLGAFAGLFFGSLGCSLFKNEGPLNPLDERTLSTFQRICREENIRTDLEFRFFEGEKNEKKLLHFWIGSGINLSFCKMPAIYFCHSEKFQDRQGQEFCYRDISFFAKRQLSLIKDNTWFLPSLIGLVTVVVALFLFDSAPISGGFFLLFCKLHDYYNTRADDFAIKHSTLRELKLAYKACYALRESGCSDMGLTDRLHKIITTEREEERVLTEGAMLLAAQNQQLRQQILLLQQQPADEGID